MHIEITQCADFVWRSMIIVDMTGFRTVFFCARYALCKKIEKRDIVKLPYTNINRSFIVIHKIKQTPDKYPRKAGMPLKKPLK